MKTTLLKQTLAAASFLLLNLAASYANTSQQISIDGKLDEAAWKNGHRIEPFKTFAGQKSAASTTGMMLWDDNMLYLGFTCEEPFMDKLEATRLSRDANIWINDCIEIFIAPFQHQPEDYYQVIVDTSGQIYDAFKHNGKLDANYDLSVTAKIRKNADSWTVEMALPLAQIGLLQTDNARINFGRERKAFGEITTWQGTFRNPETWREVSLAPRKPSDLTLRGWKHGMETPEYGNNTFDLQYSATPGTRLEVVVEALEKGRWTTKARHQMKASSQPQTRLLLSYRLLPKDQPQTLRATLRANRRSVYQIQYRLALPREAFTATPAVPYFYSEEKQALFQFRSYLTDADLKNSRLQIKIQSPEGKQTIRTISQVRKSMLVGLDVSGWQTGNGRVTAQLITADKPLSTQNFVIPKRPGPFARN